ncbi:MAG: hypothetical protein EBQ96_05875 [Proteobacteria bacterium]|nr:hypothetical protein [Pseudomonadota bacterium]
MTPPNTATAQASRATNRYIFEEAVDMDAQVAANPDLVQMGRYFIKNAIPMKGARPGNDGRCWFLLQCYRVGVNTKPGVTANRVIDPWRAQYIPYYGLMCRKKGDQGLVVGYIYDCMGSKSLGYAEAQARGVTGPTMTEASHIAIRTPTVRYAPRARYYGPYGDLIQEIDEQCRTLDAIDRIRDPKPAEPRRRSLPI